MEQFADKSYVQTTLHWQNTNGSRAQHGQQKTISDPTSFHIYSLEWQPGTIKSFLDGNQIFVMSTNNSMPFDENFFIIRDLINDEQVLINAKIRTAKIKTIHLEKEVSINNRINLGQISNRRTCFRRNP